MQKVNSVLFAAALIIGIAAFAAAPAQAFPWCQECENSGACFACCKCDGGTSYYCGFIVCGSPDSVLQTEPSWTLGDNGDFSTCVVDEALSADEATSTDEAPSTDEAAQSVSE